MRCFAIQTVRESKLIYLSNKKFLPRQQRIRILLSSAVRSDFKCAKKFQAAYSYDVDLQYRIWSFCNNFTLNYVNKRQTQNSKNLFFFIQRISKEAMIAKTQFQKFWPPKQYFGYHTLVKERRNVGKENAWSTFI